MSRYELAAHPEKPEVSHAVIGWDRPLATYFVQVFSKLSGDYKVTFWQGTAPGELKTADAAIALVEPFAIVPEDLAARLRRDVAEQPVRAPTHPMVGRHARLRREGLANAEGRIVQAHLAGFFIRLTDATLPGASKPILVFHNEIEILES